MLQVMPVRGMGEVRAGDDLAALIGDALATEDNLPKDGDVLVVTQKIVSKAEDRFVDLAAVTPGAEALRLAGVTGKDARLVELVLAETSAVVRAVPNVLITRHRSGHVMANAGIDQSNLGAEGGERVLLLPVDADASAERLRAALSARFSADVAVVVSDSFGRPWRYGVTNVAIGASGLPALVDHRGETDRDGRVLEVTQVALADMIASAAGLVTGEGAEGVPAALLRGLSWSAPDRPAGALVRRAEEDLFR